MTSYGNWTKTVQQGKGVYSEQVDPIVELRKIQQLHVQAEYTDTARAAYITDRPSEYTRMKQVRAQQRNQNVPQNFMSHFLYSVCNPR